MPDDIASPLVVHARSQSIGDLLRRSAAREPDKTAIVYRGLRQTYAELDATVNRTAAALAARGVAAGNRVAIFSHNNHTFVVAYFALARLGAVSVPINFMLTAGEVGYVLGHSGATGLIAGDALVPVAEQALTGAGGRRTRARQHCHRARRDPGARRTAARGRAGTRAGRLSRTGWLTTALLPRMSPWAMTTWPS